MRRRSACFCLVVATAFAALAAAGCADDEPRAAAQTVPTTMPTGTMSSMPPDMPTKIEGTLDLDIVSSADVTLLVHADGTLDATIAVGRGGGAFDPATKLVGKGKVSRFPEADTTLYSARLAAPAYPSGRCGAEPVSLALSLRRVGKNARVSGGISAYCGADTWSGAPVQVLRLTGNL